MFVRVQVQHYIMTVQAQDAGKPMLSSTVTVYINVIDENDNAPVFETNSYAVDVYENVTVNTVVATATAIDRDSGKRFYVFTFFFFFISGPFFCSIVEHERAHDTCVAYYLILLSVRDVLQATSSPLVFGAFHETCTLLNISQRFDFFFSSSIYQFGRYIIKIMKDAIMILICQLRSETVGILYVRVYFFVFRFCSKHTSAYQFKRCNITCACVSQSRDAKLAGSV